MLQYDMMKKLLIALAFVVTATPAQANESELQCMTMNLYHEARGEEPVGIIAVGKVVLNRVNSKLFPNTVCKVVKQGGQKRRYRCQFSWWCDGRSDKATDKKAWEKMEHYARLIFLSRIADPSGGSLFYHTVSVEPYWAASMTRVVMLGSHVFYQ